MSDYNIVIWNFSNQIYNRNFLVFLESNVSRIKNSFFFKKKKSVLITIIPK